MDDKRAILIDILRNRFSYEKLPVEALQFVVDYLQDSAAETKVACLLREATRLHGSNRLGGHHENVGYR